MPLADGSGRIALREYLAFTPEIREALLNTTPEQLIQKTEELLAKHGHKIQQSAFAAYKMGKIGKDKYLAILAEREKKEGL